MLTKGQLVKKIKATLEDGPKRARDIVKVCAERGAKSPRVFYWLKKLDEMGEIRNVEGKYELVRLEGVSKRDINFLIAKMEGKTPEVRTAAIQDFMDSCRRKRVSQYNSVWDFIRGWLKEGKDLKMYAMRFLERIASNPLTPKDEETKTKLREFEKIFEDAVVDENLEHSYRSDAIFILGIILTEQDFLDFLLKQPKKGMSVFEKLVREASGKGGSMQIDRIVWKILLNAYSRKNKLTELRKWLYLLLEDKDKRIRENAFRLLDELRGKEIGLELSVKS